ncbi:MAG: HAD-IIB family hydrolase [Mycoplasma sp.]
MSKNVIKPKYKLFSIDLDGTLLTPDKKITVKDLVALRDYMASGGEVLINTGKSFNSTMKHIRQIEEGTGMKLKYLSCLSGNYVYDLINDEVIYSNWIDSETCEIIYNICRKSRMAFMPYVKSLGGKRILNYMIYKKYIPIEAYKINTFVSVISLLGMKKLQQRLSSIPGVKVQMTHHFFYEIVKLGSDKGSAVNIIANKLNIPRKEIASIGDSFNDVPSFEVSGASFLVKADRKLNKYATHIVHTKKSRIYKVINDYFY